MSVSAPASPAPTKFINYLNFVLHEQQDVSRNIPAWWLQNKCTEAVKRLLALDGRHPVTSANALQEEICTEVHDRASTCAL
ncbi:hypothetical protein LSAT2_011432 [Lamellibrachia satsuma]|nr:hypothetical protein LSAT2_011432 [Lamellibrachia satsuma]